MDDDDDVVDDNNNWWWLILDVGGLQGPISHRDDVDLHDDVARFDNDDMTSRNHVMYEPVPYVPWPAHEAIH